MIILKEIPSIDKHFLGIFYEHSTDAKSYGENQETGLAQPSGALISFGDWGQDLTLIEQLGAVIC